MEAYRVPSRDLTRALLDKFIHSLRKKRKMKNIPGKKKSIQGKKASERKRERESGRESKRERERR